MVSAGTATAAGAFSPGRFITSSIFGGQMVTTEIRPEDAGLYQAYTEAHALIPFDYPASKEVMAAEEAKAIATLLDPHASSQATLRAIMILGHTPTTDALSALKQHMKSGKEHAGMARLAADECENMWMPNGQTFTAASSRMFARPSASLN